MPAMPPAGEWSRPRYVLENHEDDLYHNLKAGEVENEPEYRALLGRIWTFNRAMRWVRTADGNIVCHCGDCDLPLTGSGQVGAWHSDAANRIEDEGEFTRFVKCSTARRRDCAVLPCLQFQVAQHPDVEVTVDEATDDWQFVVLLKGRSGPPLAASEWRSGPGAVKLDLASALARRGYDLHYAEVHMAIGTWAKSAADRSAVRFRVRMPAQPALVPCLPVVRTAASAGSGVPVAAVATGASGELRVRAVHAGGATDLAHAGGVWTGRLAGLGPGDWPVRLVAQGGLRAEALLHVRVTDGEFYSYDHDARSLVRRGRPVGPLTGSYHGMVFARDVGTPAERLVQGQRAWDAWDRSQPPGAHYHFWEALTPAELDERFVLLASCGWHVLHLCQHWGIWERLDAGGCIAPHGAEQLALVLRTAARHDLVLLQALSHYPYGTTHTPPFAQYWEAGLRDEDWKDPASPFTAMFHAYLRDFVTLFRDETALLAMSASGEGDAAGGAGRINDTHDFVRSMDPHHVFLSEPIHRLDRLPREQCAGWKGDLYGSRMYWIGEELDPEFDQAVEFKFLQLGRCFMAEGSWPFPPPHSDFSGVADPWIGTPRYRRRVRDSYYLGLVHRMPIMITWDEQITEDEHRVLDEARKLIDWSQPFRPAPVALLVDSACVLGEGRTRLAQYERTFAARSIGTRYAEPHALPAAGATLVLDAREPYREPRAPPDLEAASPLRVSPGYCAWHLWSGDGRTLLAYVCNTMGHLRIEHTHGLCGHVFRAPTPARLVVDLRNLPPGPLRYRLYDLCDKRVAQEGTVTGAAGLACGITERDFLLLVTP